MMLQRDKLNDIILNTLNDYPDIAERWLLGDPTVTAMLSSIRELNIALSRDNDVNIIEPFIKSKNRTIMADAVNKGILPVATPCQHLLVIENHGDSSVILSQGRVVEDGTSRQWRLLSSVTIDPKKSQVVGVEQSIAKSHRFTITVSESFYSQRLPISDDSFLAGITVKNISENKVLDYTPKFMNAAKGTPVYSMYSDNLSDVSIIFGDSDRVGMTVQAGDVYEVLVTQSYGYVDQNSLKQASLESIVQDHERYLNLYFQHGGIVRNGADPLNVSQLRLLASFPATYDQNAVFMGNFDMLIRQHFMSRFGYMAIWNETVQERFYGASLDNINHLHLAVVANNAAEQNVLVNDIKIMVTKADSLLDGRVKVKTVSERSYHTTINAKLAGVHDADSVRVQIIELLLARYGKGTISASHPNSDGFNKQEIATLIREKIPAFQERISDFTVIGEDSEDNPIKPHEWLYLSRSSIHIDISRTADSGNALWAF